VAVRRRLARQDDCAINADKVVPMTPIRYSSAKLKHQPLSCERNATALQATASTAVPNAVPAKSGSRTVELIPFHAASACSGDNALRGGCYHGHVEEKSSHKRQPDGGGQFQR